LRVKLVASGRFRNFRRRWGWGRWRGNVGGRGRRVGWDVSGRGRFGHGGGFRRRFRFSSRLVASNQRQQTGGRNANQSFFHIDHWFVLSPKEAFAQQGRVNLGSRPSTRIPEDD